RSRRRDARRSAGAAASAARSRARRSDRAGVDRAAAGLSRDPRASRCRGPVARRVRDDPRVPCRHVQVATSQGAIAHARAARPARRQERSHVTCDDVRRKLTAYLDGEVDGDRGSAIRGHLRGCEACRQAATDEATLRDGLRALPPLDPPATLWANVQRELAKAEVADAERPRWKNLVAKLGQIIATPRFGIAAMVVVIGVTAVVWKSSQRSGDR